MILTTIEQWRDWSSTYTMLPYVIKLDLPTTGSLLGKKRGKKPRLIPLS